MKPKHYFFLGIGGIGNSALAQYFLQQGSQVAGYDRVQSLVTKKLEAQDIDVVYEFDSKALPDFENIWPLIKTVSRSHIVGFVVPVSSS